jgi:hypothetical protein
MRFVHVLVLLPFVAGCETGGGGGGGRADAAPAADGNPEAATVFPPLVHTGYDGVNEFKVPVSTDLSNHVEGDVDWSSDNAAVVEIASVATPDGYPAARGVWAMITTTGAGSTTVSAQIGQYTVSSPVMVATYTADQVQAGATRYTTEGGDDRQACASCHQQAGGADHTPTEMAFHEDAALLLVITAGHYPDQCLTDSGEECTCDTSGCERVPGYVLEVEHTWNLTEDEASGIVPYLRSLPPRDF